VIKPVANKIKKKRKLN